jgi:hypothetical protein
MEIHSKTLTTTEVSADGTTISLSFVDSRNRPIKIHYPMNHVVDLVMTLPSLIETALQRRFNDPTMRSVYPLGSWRWESSTNKSMNLLTFVTTDSFTITFSIHKQQSDALSEILAGRPHVASRTVQ